MVSDSGWRGLGHGEFEPQLLPLCRINMFNLLICRYLEVKSLLLWAYGLEGKVYKNESIASLVFNKRKKGWSHLELELWHRGEFEWTELGKAGGKLKHQIDQCTKIIQTLAFSVAYMSKVRNITHLEYPAKLDLKAIVLLLNKHIPGNTKLTTCSSLLVQKANLKGCLPFLKLEAPNTILCQAGNPTQLFI